MKQSLADIRIALPESRQLDVLANLFQSRGAALTRCPLVSIHDSPKVDEVNLWISEFIASTPDYLLILTGEGIRRLNGFAERMGCFDEWKQALGNTYKLARGPKPNRTLKVLSIQAQALAIEPTTDGMIKSLNEMDLDGKTLGVQLYGEDPNNKLQDYLKAREASFSTVSPYVYASDVETDQVSKLIHSLAKDEFDLIAFTSKAQYQRLEKVAMQYNLQRELEIGLKSTKIAVVGPVIAEQLQAAGLTITTMPKDKYFMKPMVKAIEEIFKR